MHLPWTESWLFLGKKGKRLLFSVQLLSLIGRLREATWSSG